MWTERRGGRTPFAYLQKRGVLRREMDLSMFLGKPTKTSLGLIYPMTLDAIDEMGYNQYNCLVGVLTFHVEDLDLGIDTTEMTTFDVVVSYCVHSVEHRALIEQALSLFFKRGVVFNDQHCVFIFDAGGVLHRNNYEEIKAVLVKQNCLRNNSEFKPEDDKARELVRKIKQMRQKYSKTSGDSGTLLDVISSVCAKHNTISPFNVGNLTLYTIFDQFKRLHAIDNYFLNMEMLMQGAKKQDVNLKHWSAPMVN